MYQSEARGDVMGLSLRIDIDNPFGYATLFKKILNRISLDYNLVPHWSTLGYLDNAMKLRDYLEANSVPATWYFRNITAPSGKDLSRFSRSPFDLALHAERTDTLLNFTKEVDQWKKAFGKQPTGFSKHGSGDLKLSRRHVMEYDDDAFVDLGVRLGFEHFSGNGTNYELRFEMREGLVFMPSVFWLDNIALHPKDTTLDSVLEFSRNNSVIVLVHPIHWAIQPEVRSRLQYVIEHADLQPITAQVREFRESKIHS